MEGDDVDDFVEDKMDERVFTVLDENETEADLVIVDDDVVEVEFLMVTEGDWDDGETLEDNEEVNIKAFVMEETAKALEVLEDTIALEDILEVEGVAEVVVKELLVIALLAVTSTRLFIKPIFCATSSFNCPDS